MRGIVNGTTNYMLTAMTREGRDYAEVLAEAQARGYAEADPTADVEGLDALNKLVILARLAFGEWIDPAVIGNRPGTTTGAPGLPGITGVTAEDVAALAREGRVLRLIATTRLAEDGAIEASVVPTAVPADSPFGRCDGVLNRVEVDATPVGRVAFEGPGRRWCRRGRRRAGRPRLDRARPGLDVGRLAGRHGAVPRGGAARRRRVRGCAFGRLLPGRGLTAMTTLPARPRLVERYREFLPVTDATPVVSLGEGATPLVAARRLGAAIGVPNLHLKIEGQNPTGSFKDRGMVLAVAKAIEEGARSVICASTGNTSASAAAYAAAAGLECVVVLPAGKIALGKLLQALVFGARVVSVSGNFDEALRVVRALSEQDDHPITLVNSVNPFRLEGQKTAAFEVCDDLGRAPDILAIPVGNAGNISAYWRGFREYRDAGRVSAVPRMWGFQAAGAAPLVLGHPVDAPETIATAIRIGNPASWDLAIGARDDSGGRISAVSDDQILHAYRELTRLEGVFCEPSSAASVAGVMAAAVAGEVDPDALVVCVLTGNGLKDPTTAESGLSVEVLEAEPTIAGVSKALGWW